MSSAGHKKEPHQKVGLKDQIYPWDYPKYAFSALL
jgi:hypothetical protein